MSDVRAIRKLQHVGPTASKSLLLEIENHRHRRDDGMCAAPNGHPAFPLLEPAHAYGVAPSHGNWSGRPAVVRALGQCDQPALSTCAIPSLASGRIWRREP